MYDSSYKKRLDAMIEKAITDAKNLDGYETDSYRFVINEVFRYGIDTGYRIRKMEEKWKQEDVH